MTSSNDVTILRDLAKRYMDIARKPIQDERRDLWRRHNSLERTRPPVLALWICAWHTVPQAKCLCEDLLFRHHESELRRLIFQDYIGDDFVIEPWITQRATYKLPPGTWGVPVKRVQKTCEEGTWTYDPVIKSLEDADKLVAPHHVIDEEATARNVERIRDAVGDIVEVNVSRAPAAGASFCTPWGNLRGLEQYMLDMLDNREWLHRVTKFIADAILAAHDDAEAAGDWSLGDSGNQAMPYAKELPDPRANSGAVGREKLWTFVCAQEMALISPAMHDEFVLQYQLPIMDKFGLVAYGCCEDLTRKIDMLRPVRNLRRIAITPWADVAFCAEQMGTDYVFSWRPNPADMICCGFDPARVRQVIKQGMDACRGCHVDITLKDVQTVQGRPEQLREWTQVVRGVSDAYV